MRPAPNCDKPGTLEAAVPAKWVHHAPVEHFRTFLPPRTASPQCLHQFGGQTWTKWQQHAQSMSPTSLASLGAVQCQPAVPQEDVTPTTATSPPPPAPKTPLGREAEQLGGMPRGPASTKPPWKYPGAQPGCGEQDRLQARGRNTQILPRGRVSSTTL